MFERGGEFLADVAALEAAGAYAELIDSSDPVSLVVLGAMAAASRSSALKLEYAFKQLSSREKRVRASSMGIPTNVASAFACP